MRLPGFSYHPEDDGDLRRAALLIGAAMLVGAVANWFAIAGALAGWSFFD